MGSSASPKPSPFELNSRSSLANPLMKELERVHALIGQGRLRDASVLALELVQQFPTDPRSWHLLSTVHVSAGHLDRALVCLERAVAYAPGDATYLLRYGQCLARLGRRREALAAAALLASMPLEHAAHLDGLGTLYSFCDEATLALPLFTRAVGCEPANSSYRYNLATAQRMVGEISAAEANLDRVIAENPDDFAAYYTRSDLRTQTPDENHVVQMQRLLHAGVADQAAEVTLCFAIAKELEDLGEYRASFQHLKRGCDLQRRSMSYDVAEDVATIERIIEVHEGSALRSARLGFVNEECIFIIGLPRSGTTLVERIIASHSQAYAAGELSAFANEAVAMVGASGNQRVSKLEFVDRALQIDPRELGRRYLAETRPQTGHTLRFIDKMPLNYLYAGLIRRALPQAKIIAVEREPMDSCYAMYKTLFTAAYPFSYDLDDLGRYYLAWNRLMRHWTRVLGDSLLTVRYEDLVAHQETVSRRIIRHCGLRWEEQCLIFHRHPGAVATASAVQIRQPLYASSIGKWRRYSEELAGLSRRIAALQSSAP